MLRRSGLRAAGAALLASCEELAAAAYQICGLREQLCWLPAKNWQPQPTSFRNVVGQKHGRVRVGRFWAYFEILFPSNYGFMTFTGPRKGARGRFRTRIIKFVPFFTLPAGVRKGQKGTNFYKCLKNAQIAEKEAGKRLFSCLRRVQIFKKPLKTPKSCLLRAKFHSSHVAAGQVSFEPRCCGPSYTRIRVRRAKPAPPITFYSPCAIIASAMRLKPAMSLPAMRS